MQKRALIYTCLSVVIGLTAAVWMGHVAQPVTAEPAAPTAANLVPKYCDTWFLSGVNVPWQNTGYGADFGTVEEWGQHLYSAAQTEAMFAELQAAGVNTVRWWVFTDGRGAPEFSANNGGTVTGLDANFLPSMASAVQLADQYDLYIVFSLWDFAMLFNDSTAFDRGEHSGGHRNLFVNSSARQSFIDNALLPMLAHPVGEYTLGTHPHILAWEIMNEPEWTVSELDAVDSRVPQPVSLAQMQRFVAELSSVIHQNSNQMVTVGSAALKWNSDTALGATGNIWADDQLAPYAADGTLDFYQIHYYHWMDGDGVNWSFSPLVNSYADASLDKPTVIGEFSANEDNMNQFLTGLLNNGYAGAWSWGYEQVDAHGGWADSKAGYTTFNQNNRSITNIANVCTPAAYIPMVVR